MTPVPIVAAVIQICGILLKRKQNVNQGKRKTPTLFKFKSKGNPGKGNYQYTESCLKTRYVGTHLKSKHSAAGSTQDLYFKINNNKKFQKNFRDFIMF